MVAGSLPGHSARIAQLPSAIRLILKVTLALAMQPYADFRWQIQACKSKPVGRELAGTGLPRMGSLGAAIEAGASYNMGFEHEPAALLLPWAAALQQDLLAAILEPARFACRRRGR